MSFSKATNIKLYQGVPLDIERRHTIKFGSQTAQSTYFNTKVFNSLDNASYQREERYIRYPAIYDEIHDCNYLSFQNTSATADARIQYAFITRMEYINENLTYVYFEIDYIQTYLFDVTIGECFVERETVSSDGLGEHLLPEPVELGQYDYDYVSTETMLLSSYYYVVAKKWDNAGGTVPPYYNGISSALELYAYPGDTTGGTNAMVQAYTFDAQAEGSVAWVCLMPALALYGYTIDETTHRINPSNFIGAFEWSLPRPLSSMSNGFIPVNKKLLSYPYSYFTVSNNQGTVKEYHYEHFPNSATSGSIPMQPIANISNNVTVRLEPVGWCGASGNLDAGMSLMWDCQCNYITSSYLSWLNQNKANYATAQTTSMISGLANSAILAAAGNTIDAGATLADTTADLLQRAFVFRQQEQVAKDRAPKLAGTAGSDSLDVAISAKTFDIFRVALRAEWAMKADNYFSRYGYNVSCTKVPDLDSRTYWNYIQATDCIMTGDVPNECLTYWKARFANGITFWHDTNVGNYNRTNAIA